MRSADSTRHDQRDEYSKSRFCTSSAYKPTVSRIAKIFEENADEVRTDRFALRYSIDLDRNCLAKCTQVADPKHGTGGCEKRVQTGIYGEKVSFGCGPMKLSPCAPDPKAGCPKSCNREGGKTHGGNDAQ